MGKKRRSRRHRRDPLPFKLRLGILITVLVFIVVASGVLMFPGFGVDEVYCEGCINTNPTDLISASRIETGENILLANVGRAEREISKMPLVDSVSVKRVFPDKICITVTECVPSAYVMAGVECVAIDKEGVVLEIINDDRVRVIAKKNTPQSLVVQQANENSSKKPDENEKDTDTDTDTDTGDSLDIPKESPEEGANEMEETPNIYAIPLVGGLELENAKEGKSAKATEPEKFTKLLEVCGALNEAGLLNRATYIDITNLTDIKVHIENRLEVQLGKAENCEYRMKFLSEVINTKISATEKAVMDYHGDDIYVRTPEDGKSRTVPDEEPEEETEESAEEESSQGDEEKEIKVPDVTL